MPGAGEPRGLYRFLATLRAEAPHGARFLYRSAESDVLGWVCERAAGLPMATLISELIWAPMGAERDAALLHDGLGAAVHDGGLSATARDVARFGQMLLDGGLIPDGPGAPAGWCRPSGSAGPGRSTPTPGPRSPRRRPSGRFPAGGTGTSSGSAPATTATCCSAWASTARCCTSAGRTNTVCVKFSAWPEAQNPAYLEDTLRAFDAVGGFLRPP